MHSAHHTQECLLAAWERLFCWCPQHKFDHSPVNARNRVKVFPTDLQQGSLQNVCMTSWMGQS